eukprot:scaffold7367_cov16-Tisochrysis_lutea.AAC.1
MAWRHSNFLQSNIVLFIVHPVLPTSQELVRCHGARRLSGRHPYVMVYGRSEAQKAQSNVGADVEILDVRGHPNFCRDWHRHNLWREWIVNHTAEHNYVREKLLFDYFGDKLFRWTDDNGNSGQTEVLSDGKCCYGYDTALVANTSTADQYGLHNLCDMPPPPPPQPTSPLSPPSPIPPPPTPSLPPPSPRTTRVRVSQSACVDA